MSNGAHPYALPGRTWTAVVLMLAAVAAAYAWARIQVACELGIPWYVDTPAVFGSYGLLGFLMNKWGWRWGPLAAILSIPDLAGTWVGVAASSKQAFEEDHEVRLIIRQTWLSMSVVLEAEQSTSKSVAAHVSHGQGSEAFTLHYQYINTPRAGAPREMEAHHGTAFLRLSDDCQEIEGEYYTGRGRVTHGRMKFRRVQ